MLKWPTLPLWTYVIRIKNKIMIVTQEEYNKQENAVIELAKEVKKASEQAYDAAQHGDSRENLEHEAAKQNLALIKARFNSAEDELSAYTVVSHQEIREILKNDRVSVFSNVELDINGESNWFSFRPSAKRPETKLVTANSPLGQAILGKSIGDSGSYNVENKKFDIEILTLEAFEDLD